MMNRTFMNGYYQGVVEDAPASLSAAQVEELAVTMTIQDFLVDDIGANSRLVTKFINLTADELETAQARIMAIAFAK